MSNAVTETTLINAQRWEMSFSRNVAVKNQKLVVLSSGQVDFLIYSFQAIGKEMEQMRLEHETTVIKFILLTTDKGLCPKRLAINIQG